MTDNIGNPVGEKLFDSWLQSALEYDRSLLVVASAGLGLIASLADKPSGDVFLTRVALVIAAAAFAIVVGSVLAIFQINKIFIETEDRSDRETRVMKRLKFLDAVVVGAFSAGIATTVIATGLLIFQKGDKPVNNEDLDKKILEAVERGELNLGMESLVNVKKVAHHLVGSQANPASSPQATGHVGPVAAPTSNAAAKPADTTKPAKP